jgi:hypothetical protein
MSTCPFDSLREGRQALDESAHDSDPISVVFELEHARDEAGLQQNPRPGIQAPG